MLGFASCDSYSLGAKLLARSHLLVYLIKHPLKFFDPLYASYLYMCRRQLYDNNEITLF